MNVLKRNGKHESLNLDKIHKMVEIACEGLHGVSPSQVEMRSGLQFYDGISTKEIQSILIRSASDLISLDNPDYQYVAARLLLFSLRKDVFGGDWNFEFPSIKQHLLNNKSLNIYDNSILDEYTSEELDSINIFIQHDRDFIFTYAGLRQVFDKYLVQDRVANKIYETPQFMYILIAMNVYRNEDKSVRLKLIKEYYNLLSEQKINIPTPILANLRTPNRNSVSCVLIDVDDTRDSINHSDVAMGIATSTGSGIGVNAGRLRGIGTPIRNGSIVSNGVIPFLKKFESTIRSWSQGTRGGNCTVNFPIWHQEIRDIIVLKNNKGTGDNRVRKVDYCIQFSELFYRRYLENGEITLFSPHDVKDLYEAFGLPEFDELYISYENNPNVKKTTVSAKTLINDLIRESYETGRVYVMNIDHANSHSPFKGKVSMTNLCVAGETQIFISYFNKATEEVSFLDIEIKDLNVYLNNSEIEDVRVLSYDIETKNNKFSPILAFAQTSPKAKVIKIIDYVTFNGIILTPEHQVYTKNRGYVSAKDLLETDELLISSEILSDEKTGITIIELNEEIPVYDITVEGTHNFFGNNILVHNCIEIFLESKPIQHIDDENGLIPTCILSGVNLGKIKKLSDLEHICYHLVLSLDNIIEWQKYPIIAAEKFTKNYRALGLGFTNFAYYLAKHKVSYNSQEALELTHDLAEAYQYYCLKASNKIAKERGTFTYYENSKYSQGILPIDTYKKSIDELIPNNLKLDWKSLRNDILTYGLRNVTLTAQFPSESCLFWKHEIKTSNGFMNFHEIAEYGNIDWKEIESKNQIGWYDLKNPIEVETQEGYKSVDKLYFNGNKEIISIILENDKVIKCTSNHRFLINQEDGTTIWKRVYELEEGDDIVEI